MTAKIFVDTNVLLYTIDEDPSSARKREIAQQLLLTESWVWSVQVASEFFVNATSPKRPFRLTSTDASARLHAWFAFPIQSFTADLVVSAIDVQRRYQLSYWDAAIIAAAHEMGCDRLFSENLNAGQAYDGVVVNPFAIAARD